MEYNINFLSQLIRDGMESSSLVRNKVYTH